MSFLDSIPLDPEEVRKSIMQTAEDRKNNPEICICGHAARAHTSHAKSTSAVHATFRNRGEEKCFPLRQMCPCTEFRAVVKTRDTRNFTFKTTGAYNGHALFKGILHSIDKASSVEPIPATGWVCDSCGSTENVGPVPINSDKMVAEEPTQRNYLLCEACYKRAIEGTLFTSV